MADTLRRMPSRMSPEPLRRTARALWFALCGATAAAATPAAFAWGSLLLIERPPEVATFAVGPSLWALPAFPGARKSPITLLPGLDYYAPSGFFASTDNAVGWNFSQRADLQAGLRLWPQFGRKARDLPAGIGALRDSLQTEAFVNLAVLPELLLQSGLLHGSGQNHDGAQFEIGATGGLPIGADLLGIGVAASYANRAYRQRFFGVSAQQAANSGLPVFATPNGWQDASLTLSIEHKFDAHWHLDGQFIAARLLGAAARSPLTESKRQRAATLTLWHDF